MKLLFPNGDHGPVVLSTGVTTIGADAGATIRLSGQGIGLIHCEIDYNGVAALIRVHNRDNETHVNNTLVISELAVKAGDALKIGSVHCRVVDTDRPAAAAPAARPASDAEGATKVRMALPKFMLRGVSGSTFGKNFALKPQMTIGRSADCEISIPTEEVSRRHAMLKLAADGVVVEDLGSANGTFINGERVQRGTLKPGDELRLDNVRFMLVVPGQEITAAAKTSAPTQATAPAAKSSRPLPLIVGGVVALIVVIVGGLYAAGMLG